MVFESKSLLSRLSTNLKERENEWLCVCVWERERERDLESQKDEIELNSHSEAHPKFARSSLQRYFDTHTHINTHKHSYTPSHILTYRYIFFIWISLYFDLTVFFHFEGTMSYDKKYLNFLVCFRQRISSFFQHYLLATNWSYNCLKYFVNRQTLYTGCARGWGPSYAKILNR